MASKPSVVDVVRQQIRQLRIDRGLTQEQVSERANISIDAITRIERGGRVPTLPTLERIADALRVPVTDLLGKAQRARKEPAVVRRIAALLDGQPAHAQQAVEVIVKAVVRALQAGKAARER